MDAFHEHVGGDEHFAVGVAKYGTVVAYAVQGGLVLRLDVVGEVVDEAKLAEFCDVHVWKGIEGLLRGVKGNFRACSPFRG